MLGNDEDVNISKSWLQELVGEANASANLYVLSAFYRGKDYWLDYMQDDENSCIMSFKTYPIYFGKDYRYTVKMIAKYKGDTIVDTSNDYSRYQVGNEQPEFDFCQLVCDKLRKQDIEFYNELFATP